MMMISDVNQSGPHDSLKYCNDDLLRFFLEDQQRPCPGTSDTLKRNQEQTT